MRFLPQIIAPRESWQEKKSFCRASPIKLIIGFVFSEVNTIIKYIKTGIWMRIKTKIILITFPLIITPLLLTIIIVSLSTRNGITVIANDFLKFKSDVFINYMDSQWDILVRNNLDKDEKYIDLSKKAVMEHAFTLIRKETESINIFTEEGDILFSTKPDFLKSNDNGGNICSFLGPDKTGWQEMKLCGINSIAQISFFKPFNWYIIVAAEKKVIYNTIMVIYLRTAIVLSVSMLIAFFLLMYFSGYLTKPLEHVVSVIQSIISTNDLKEKVPLLYQDETGKLSHYFNIMTEQLDHAYMQLKKYALHAVIAHKKEMRIRNIFQKYVPTDVIDSFFAHPEAMLVGENRVLSILFSDIRSFTTISEGLAPDDLVNSLNKYFEMMVDVILSHNGIVDKYIGDAIMAFFGAPVKHNDDPLQSVNAALDMIDKLNDFNEWERRQGKSEFRIGIGINYGVVTVGNIGSEKKMDYTVIGDMVNLASRLEGLTKKYKEQIIISESLYRKIEGVYPCRMLDKVKVKGKKTGVNIYAVKKSITPETKTGWDYFHHGQECYYKRDFNKAFDYFKTAQEYLPDDFMLKIFEDRTVNYMVAPPLDDDWTGETVLDEK